MRSSRLFAFAFAAVAFSSSRAALFNTIQLEPDGSKLLVLRTDGNVLSAPKFDNQDGFEKPAVSADQRHVGWLAMYPDQGATYSQPVELIVLGPSNKTRRFAGHFGMVYQWCFSQSDRAVVYRYQFPHGATPVGFEMRRLSNGQLMRRVKLLAAPPEVDQTSHIRNRAPTWTRCAQEGRNPQ